MRGGEQLIRLQPFRKGPGDYSESEMERKPGYILLLKKKKRQKEKPQTPPSLESRDRSTGCKTHEVIFPLLSTAHVAPPDTAEVMCLQKYVGQLSF